MQEVNRAPQGAAPGQAGTIRRPLLALLAIFALLWLPFGQQDYLYAAWPLLALGGGVAILFTLALLRPAGTSSQKRAQIILLTVLACYLLHQFEEHGVDLKGGEYAFIDAINAQIGPRFGCEPGSLCPFDPQGIFLVNTILVWWLLASVAVVGGRSVLADLMAVSVMTVNALTHIGAALAQGAYNPGLATALVLFVPVGIGASWMLVRLEKGRGLSVVLATLYGVLLHLILLAGIWLVFRQIISPAIYGLLMFAAASLPATIAFSAHAAKS
jgi:hypothetical protein